MSSLLSNLSEADQESLLKNIYYLNLGELKSFCDKHGIPYRIRVETENGKTRLTGDKDRMKIVINRVVHFLITGERLPGTLFRKEIVKLSGLPAKLGKNDRLYYGCYEKKNPKMISLLQDLTNGEFKNGAISRILCREFWSRGEAPTFAEYATAWIKAREDYSLKQHPEAAYLTDLSKGMAGSDWKKKRIKKAGKVIELLEKVLDIK